MVENHIYSTTVHERYPFCIKTEIFLSTASDISKFTGYQADVICLQEVDNQLYTSYYNNVFKNKNYTSFYHRKGNRISEGLSCFFDKTRFRMLDDRQIIFSNEIKTRKFLYLWNFMKKNENLRECFLKQMTSLQITVLQAKVSKTNYVCIVGNTHLFYHPEAELVRLIQIHMATAHLFKSKEYHSRTLANSVVTVILCGDLNSTPTSAVYQYMVKGKIGKDHPVFTNSQSSIDLSHNFDFKSACGTPKYTNYTDNFKNCLDYIFIENDKINVKRVIPLPSEEELAAYEGLPNDVYPSDHLALVVDLQMI